MAARSKFAETPLAPPDPILGVTLAFRADPHPDKVNLGVGAYRTEEGEPYPLPVVQKVESALAAAHLDHEYLPIDGLAAFTSRSAAVVLGADSRALAEKRVCACQSLSGTGALRLAGEFLFQFLPRGTKCYISDPTWGNHVKIFSDSGFEVLRYRYFDKRTSGLDFGGLTEDLRNMPEGSLVVLHTCAHNPTGVDPSKEEWNAICDIVQERNLFPIFDTAYQGFASGDLDEDAYSVRLFVERGVELFVTQSYAKNFGLYGERIGAVVAVLSDSDACARALSQLKLVARAMYSNPPIHGARIVAEVLGNPEYVEEWKGELRIMSGRIHQMREQLRGELERIGCPGTWNHITDQIGMFSFTGLTPAQVQHMREKWHIYMTGDGRISMAGLTTRNVPYMASAMKDAIQTHP